MENRLLQSTVHYAVMKYAKIEIENKTLCRQTQRGKGKERRREGKRRAVTTETIVLRGSVSAPRQREFVQLSKLAAIFNRTNCCDLSVLRDAEEFPTYSPTYLRYFSELCIALRRGVALQRNLDWFRARTIIRHIKTK